MPVPKKVDLLPEPIRLELDRELIKRGFSGYHELSDWLLNKGYEIKHASLGEYGKNLKKRVGDARFFNTYAKAIVEELGDDENSMGEALIRMAQIELMKAFETRQEAEEEISLDKMVRAAADLNRAAVGNKKYRLELRDKVNERLKNLEAENLDKETLRRVREDIYGLFE